MKVSFEIARGSAEASGAATGKAIKSPVAKPEHAEILRSIFGQRPSTGKAGVAMKRAYDAATTSNLNQDFIPSTASANAEIITSLPLTRNRARKLCRDNQYAKGIVRTYKNNVVGDDPFRLEMKLGKKDATGKFIEETDTNNLIEDAWREAGLPQNCTSQGEMSRMELYQLVEASAIRDGSILGRHFRGFPFNKFGYAIRMFEADRLDSQYMGRAPDTGNPIRFSIERDLVYDRPVAYWILSRHPGDVFGYTGAGGGPTTGLYAGGSSSPYARGSNVWRERVVAEDIIHFNNLRDRAEQDVGMTEFDTVIQTLHRIEQFDIAHVTAAIWASCKPFFILQKFPTGLEYIGEAMKNAIDSQQDEKGGVTAPVEPATGEVLGFGQEPFLVDPKFPIESGPEFKKEQLKGIASGSGIAYHTLANDLASVNFSSGRLGENAQRDQFKVHQAHMIFCFVRRHFAEWLRSALNSGVFDGKIAPSRYDEILNAAMFHAKRWPYVNPLQDAQADIIRIEAGLDSRAHVIAESDRGGDVETVDAEIASGKAIDEAHLLDFGTDPTKPEVPSGQVDDPAAAPSADTPPKTGGKQTIKSRTSRVNYERLDRSIAVLSVTGDARNGKH